VSRLSWILWLATAVMLTACSKEHSAEAPPPQVMGGDATGHYCGMLLAEHPGPKGQVLLKSRDEPVWFSSVRDTFTFLRLPEEPKDVAAVYVSDMGKAPNWEQPGNDNWILAKDAVFVVGSDRQGGMSGAEAVPFSHEDAARVFISQHGGRILRFEDALAAIAEAGHG
jgi:copper chaperone NosL